MRGVAAKLWSWLLDYWQATLWQVQGLRMQTFPQVPQTQGTKHIIIIPGVFEPPTFMASLIYDARRAGYVVHGLNILGYNTGQIPQAAKDVDAYIRERNLGSVTILAHSKGGLIGKYVQALFDTDRRIDRMITIATPFSGSPLARLLPIRSVRDFLPTAEIITQLQQLSNANQRIISIYGSFDPHIPGGSFLPGAKNIRVRAMGHFRILKSPDVRHAVLQNLE